MKAKRIQVFFLSLVLLLTMTACGVRQEPAEGIPDVTEVNEEQTVEEAEEPAEEVPEETGEEAIGLTPRSKNIKVSWFIPWWDSPEEYQYIFDDFARKFPDYVIDNSIQSGDIQQLAASIQAGTQADVWVGGDPNWAQYVTAVYQGLLTPLDDFLTHDPEFNFETICSRVLNASRFADGRFYSIPTAVMPHVLIWNKDIFARAGIDPDRPPETWSEFHEYAQKLVQFDSRGMATQLGVFEGPANWIFRALRAPADQHVVSLDGTRSRFNESWVRESDAFTGTFDELYGGAAKLPSGVTFNVQSGNVGMQIGNLASLNEYSEQGIDFGFGKLPRPDDIDEHVVPTLLWMYVGIPRGSQNPEGGWKFIRHALSEALIASSEAQFRVNPSRWIPDYIAHEPTREKVYEMFLPFVDADILELVNRRDELMNEINYYYPYSPLQMRSVELHHKWGDKFTNNEVNVYEMYEGLHNELQAELDLWLKDMLNRGWKFPEGGKPIAPW